MRYIIDMALFGALPAYTRVVLLVRGLDNTQKAAISLNLLRKAEQTARAELANTDLAGDPHVATWRRAYSLFSVGDEQPASMLETLLGWAVAGKPIPDADPLTNLLRAFALQNRIPVGGDDLDLVSGNVWLRPSRGNELFAPLNRPDQAETPDIGEIITVDDASAVLCRHWNAWPGDLTKITPSTRNALLHLDALPPVDRLHAENLGEKLAKLVGGFVGGEVTMYLLSADQPAIHLQPR
jgi:DNA/RNA-binding domain of Phe-tRNA-synthetase-like protein